MESSNFIYGTPTSTLSSSMSNQSFGDSSVPLPPSMNVHAASNALHFINMNLSAIVKDADLYWVIYSIYKRVKLIVEPHDVHLMQTEPSLVKIEERVNSQAAVSAQSAHRPRRNAWGDSSVLSAALSGVSTNLDADDCTVRARRGQGTDPGTLKPCRHILDSMASKKVLFVEDFVIPFGNLLETGIDGPTKHRLTKVVSNSPVFTPVGHVRWGSIVTAKIKSPSFDGKLYVDEFINSMVDAVVQLTDESVKSDCVYFAEFMGEERSHAMSEHLLKHHGGLQTSRETFTDTMLYTLVTRVFTKAGKLAQLAALAPLAASAAPQNSAPVLSDPDADASNITLPATAVQSRLPCTSSAFQVGSKPFNRPQSSFESHLSSTSLFSSSVTSTMSPALNATERAVLDSLLSEDPPESAMIVSKRGMHVEKRKSKDANDKTATKTIKSDASVIKVKVTAAAVVVKPSRAKRERKWISAQSQQPARVDEPLCMPK